MSLEANKFIYKSSEIERIQQLKIIEIIKDNLRQFQEEIQEDNTIDKSLLLKFNTLYNNFTYELFKLAEDMGGENYNLDSTVLANRIFNIIQDWNAMVIFMTNKLKYIKLEPINRRYIDNKISKIYPDVKFMSDKLKRDIKSGKALITSIRHPSGDLLNVLENLKDKINNNDYTLISFKFSRGKLTEVEPEDEPEDEDDEPEDDDADDARVREQIRIHRQREEERSQREEEERLQRRQREEEYRLQRRQRDEEERLQREQEYDPFLCYIHQ